MSSGVKKETIVSDETVYLNVQPFIIKTKVNMTDPVINVFYNEQKLDVTPAFSNGEYTTLVGNVTVPGYIKITYNNASHTLTEVVTVKQPYLFTRNNLETFVEQGTTVNIEFTSYNPQNQVLVADSIDIDIYDPDDVKTSLVLEKSGEKFTGKYKFEKPGGYIFRAHANKQGYAVQEDRTVINVLASGAIPFIAWFWVGGFSIFIILFAIARLTGRQIKWQ